MFMRGVLVLVVILVSSINLDQSSVDVSDVCMWCVCVYVLYMCVRQCVCVGGIGRNPCVP